MPLSVSHRQIGGIRDVLNSNRMCAIGFRREQREAVGIADGTAFESSVHVFDGGVDFVNSFKHRAVSMIELFLAAPHPAERVQAADRLVEMRDAMFEMSYRGKVM